MVLISVSPPVVAAPDCCSCSKTLYCLSPCVAAAAPNLVRLEITVDTTNPTLPRYFVYLVTDCTVSFIAPAKSLAPASPAPSFLPNSNAFRPSASNPALAAKLATPSF